MTPIQLPRFDGKTTDERIKQIENAFFTLTEQINQNFSMQEQEIKSKGSNDGTV